MCAVSARAETLLIRDGATGKALALASVYSESPRISRISDAEGRVDLSGFFGADDIRVELIGYRSALYSYAELREMRFVLSLEEEPFVMSKIIISSTRWREETRDVPGRTLSIDPERAEIRETRNAADLLGSSGEVFVQKSQLGGGSPALRGFAANRVLIAVDGVRMNTAIFRGGNVQNVVSLDPMATERTEIAFGPGSLMYGSDAIGGVICFYTIEPRFAENGTALFDGSATARSGTAGFEKRGHLHFNIGRERWAFVTSATCVDFDHLRMGNDGPDDFLRPDYVETINGKDTLIANHDPQEQVPTGYGQINLMQKARFRPRNGWDLNYGFHYSRSSDVPRYDRLIEREEGRPKHAEWYYGPQVWIMNSLAVEHSGTNIIYDDARLTLAAQYFRESRHDRAFEDPTFRHRIEKVRALSANFDMKRAIRPRHTLFYGVEAVHNRIGSEAEQENIETGAVTGTGTRYPNGSAWTSYAAYLNHHYRPYERFTFRSGLRYNRVTMRSDFDTTYFPLPYSSARMNTGALTGSAGFVCRPGKAWEISLNLSTGFRAPNVDDMSKVFDSEPGSVVVPNPDLKPEYAYNAEISIAKTICRTAKLDITGYCTILDDALLRRDFTLAGQDSVLYDGGMSRVQAVQNAAEAYVAGVQAGAEILLPAGIRFLSRINIQEGKEEDEYGNLLPMRHAVPWFGVARLVLQRERWDVCLCCRQSGGFDFKELPPSERAKPHLYALDGNSDPYSPGWWTLGFEAACRLNERLTFTAGVENILDKRYRPYSSGLAAPGKSFAASIRTDY